MPVQVTARVTDATELATPLLIVPVTTSEVAPAHLAALDATVGGAIATAWASGDFAGKRDQTALLYPAGPVTRLLLVGMGDAASDAAIRRAAMIAGKRARAAGVASASLLPPPSDLPSDRLGQLLGEGIPFGAWHYPHYKKPSDPPKPELATVEVIVATDDAGLNAGLARGAAIATGQALTRRLQVLPADTCTPEFLADEARQLAARHGMTVTVLDRAGLEAEGMGGILAVGQGSANEPRFIVLEHMGADEAPVVLVGKGVTFDSGGISIKPATNMEEMKYDMSGAAAVLGTMEAVGGLGLARHVVALVPTAENMVSGRSYRPGDVVRGHSGKTIEVINTDAEGRLLLGDALAYAKRLSPAAVVDCATLTGAVVIALGNTVSAVLGTDEELIGELRTAGLAADERVWELPIWDEYRELIKSDIADMKNSGGRPAGTITAAWFLREHVGEYPWAHIDIAGTAYLGSSLPTQEKGPTGVLVRLFSEFLLARG